MFRIPGTRPVNRETHSELNRSYNKHAFAPRRSATICIPYETTDMQQLTTNKKINQNVTAAAEGACYVKVVATHNSHFGAFREKQKFEFE